MTTATALKLITDMKALDKAIVSIANRGKKLDSDIQLAGLSCLDMIEKHGNIGPMNRLHAALSKGARKNALLEWGVTFGKLSLNEGADKKESPFVFNREGVTNMALAVENPWYDFQPEKAIVLEFSLQAMVAQLIKKAEDAAKRDGAVLDDTHNEKLAALKALAV